MPWYVDYFYFIIFYEPCIGGEGSKESTLLFMYHVSQPKLWMSTRELLFAVGHDRPVCNWLT